MDKQELLLLGSIWSLVVKHQQLLGDVLPVVSEIVATFRADSRPSDEQLHAWQERYDEMNQRMSELTEDVLSLRQALDLRFRYEK